MRKLSLSLALLAGAVAPVAAQAPMAWTPEIGVRLGYTMTSIGDDDFSWLSIPGGNGVLGFGGVSTVYGVIPVGGRFAIEPGLGLQDQTNFLTGTPVTTSNVSARVLFSAWRGLYVGAGPTMLLVKADGQQETSFGAQLGVGYRMHLTGNLVGRAEVTYDMQQANDEIGVTDDASTIGLVLGLGITPNAPAGGRSTTSDGLWQWAFGIQSAYQHTSGDGFEATGFAFPGSQGSITYAGIPLPMPGIAPIFVQIPVAKRIALEPSFSYSSVSINDGDTEVSSYAVGLRANYALNRTLYAAVSGDYTGIGGDLDVDGATGFGAAFGARFPIVAGFSGRTELSWRQFNGDEAFLGDYTVTGLSFAILAPLR